MSFYFLKYNLTFNIDIIIKNLKKQRYIEIFEDYFELHFLCQCGSTSFTKQTSMILGKIRQNDVKYN